MCMNLCILFYFVIDVWLKHWLINQKQIKQNQQIDRMGKSIIEVTRMIEKLPSSLQGEAWVKCKRCKVQPPHGRASFPLGYNVSPPQNIQGTHSNMRWSWFGLDPTQISLPYVDACLTFGAHGMHPRGQMGQEGSPGVHAWCGHGASTWPIRTHSSYNYKRVCLRCVCCSGAACPYVLLHCFRSLLLESC